MRKIILIILIFISFLSTTSAFDAVTTSVYLQNNKTNEIKVFNVKNFDTKTLLEIGFINKLSWKNIWDKNIIWNWDIIEFCSLDNCYNQWKLAKNSYIIYLEYWSKYNQIESKINSKYLEEFNISDLNFNDKVKLFDWRIFWNLILEFIIFLPLNLLIFQCFWYFLYLLFLKYYNISYFKKIYLNAWIFYLISLIILYTLGYWFMNWNSAMMWFMWYFMFVWIFKLIIYLISRYTIEKYKKDENIKSDFEKNIYIYYLLLFILTIIYNKLF